VDVRTSPTRDLHRRGEPLPHLGETAHADATSTRNLASVPVSPYIQQLRQIIGTALIFIPAVSVLAVDDEDRVLLVYEVDQDAWSAPGGAIDVDERPEDAARRELLEETGLVVELDGIVAVLGGPEFHVRYKNGDEIAYVTTVYRGTVVGGDVSPDGEEVSAVEWFPIGSLRDVTLNQFATELFRTVGWL
jgi:ADP-ribose pyrophosphatase YjhB (NUDIX family)